MSSRATQARRERALAAGMCPRCYQRPLARGRRGCTTCLALAATNSRQRTAITAAPSAAPPPSPYPVRLFLLPDGHADATRGIRARRGDCLRLRSCEEEWISDEARRPTQGRCPRVCPGFAPRPEVRS